MGEDESSGAIVMTQHEQLKMNWQDRLFNWFSYRLFKWIGVRSGPQMIQIPGMSVWLYIDFYGNVYRIVPYAGHYDDHIALVVTLVDRV